MIYEFNNAELHMVWYVPIVTWDGGPIPRMLVAETFTTKASGSADVLTLMTQGDVVTLKSVLQTPSEHELPPNSIISEPQSLLAIP